MSAKYIEQLEEENESLRSALKNAITQLSNNWSDSLTLGLIPELHYFDMSTFGRLSSPALSTIKSFKSLRILREHIISLDNRKDSRLFLRSFDSGDGRTKIYDENSIVDSDGVTITNYIIDYYIVR